MTTAKAPRPGTKAREAYDRKARALDSLRDFCPPGTEVWSVVKRVARSGMSRRITFMVASVDHDGRPSVQGITHLISDALGYKWNDDGSITVSGCGMDMCFHVVNSLSYALHGYENIGDDAKRAAVKGVPFKPTATAYRAGYTLTSRTL